MRVTIAITVDGTSSDGTTIEHLGILRQDVVPSAFDGTTTAYASAADDEEKKKE